VEVEATATLMEGLMEAVVLAVAVVSEEVSAQVTAVAADMGEGSDGAVPIRPRALRMEDPLTGPRTK
jgi:argininosuccinate synthase